MNSHALRNAPGTRAAPLQGRPPSPDVAPAVEPSPAVVPQQMQQKLQPEGAQAQSLASPAVERRGLQRLPQMHPLRHCMETAAALKQGEIVWQPQTCE